MASLSELNKQLDMARSNLKKTKKDMEGLTAAGKALGAIGSLINSDSFKMASNSAETLTITNKIKDSYDQILERGKQLFAIGKSGQSLKPYQQEVYELKKEITSLIEHSQNLANYLKVSMPESKPERATKTYDEIINKMKWIQAKNKELLTIEEQINYIKKERTYIPHNTEDSYKALQLQRDLEEKLAKKQERDLEKSSKSTLEKMILLEKMVSRANATGFGDAKALRSHYEALNAEAHANGAFKLGQDSGKFTSMANARLAQHIKEFYSSIEEKASKAGKSIEEYTQELLESQGVERDSSDTLEQYISKLHEVAEVVDEANKAKEKADREAAKAEADAVEETKRLWDEKLGYIKQVLNGIASAVKGVVSIILGIVKTAFNGVVKTFDTIKNTVTQILTLFSNFGNRVRQAFGFGNSGGQHFNISLLNIKETMTSLVNVGRSLKSTFDQIFNNSTVNSAKQLLSGIFAMTSIMGQEITDEVINWAKDLESSYGVSVSNTIKTVGGMAPVLKGLGMNGEDVGIAASNLTVVGNYLAMMGAAGGDANLALSKIQSGLRGMTAAIDDIGLSVREEEMNSFLKSMKAQGGEFANISTSFSSLNEQSRIYVRYASIMSQFSKSYDLNNYSEGLNTISGRLSILNQTFDSLVATIGTGLAKIGAYIAGFLIPILKVVQEQVAGFFNWLGGMLNLDLDTSIWSGANGNTGTTKTNEELEETKENLDGVTASAEKAKGALMGFDKLNNINESSSSSGSGDGSEFDYSKLMEQEYSNLIAKMELAKENFFKSLEEQLGDSWLNIKGIFEKIKNGFKLFIESLAIDLDAFGVREKLGTLFSTVLDALNNNILPKLKAPLQNLYGNVIKPIAWEISKAVSQNLDWITAKVTEFSNWFADPDNAETIDKWFENIGEIITSIAGVIRPIIKQLCTWFDEGVTAIAEWLGSLTDDQKTEKITGFFNKLSAIVTDSLGIIDTLFKDVLLPLIKEIGQWFMNDGIDWFGTKIKEVGDYLSTHGEEIRSLLSDIGGIVWTGFKSFVDILSKAIKLLVDNPDIAKMLFIGVAGKSIMDPGVTSGAKQAGSGIGTAVAGGVGLAGGAALANGGLSGLLSGASGALAGIGAVAGPIAIVVATLASLSVVIGDLLIVSESFGDTFGGVINRIINAIDGLISKFIGEEGLGSKLSGLKDSFDTICLKIEPLISILIELAGSVITLTITQIGNLIDFVLSTVVGVIDLISGVITKDSQKIFDGISGVIGGILNFLGSTVVNFVKAGANIIAGLVNGIIQGHGEDAPRIRAVWDKFVEGFKNFFGIHSPSTVFYDFGVNIVEGLKNGIVNTWESLMTKVTGVFTEFKTTLKNKVDEVKAIITENPITEGISAGVDFVVNKVTGNNKVSVPSVKGFANGGVPESGSLIYTGENGIWETVGNFGGYTGVANQGMVTDAMKQAVIEGMLTAFNSMNRNKQSIPMPNIPDRPLYTREEVRYLWSYFEEMMLNSQTNIAYRSFGI